VNKQFGNRTKKNSKKIMLKEFGLQHRRGGSEFGVSQQAEIPPSIFPITYFASGSIK
jgi:hypothetical protein